MKKQNFLLQSQSFKQLVLWGPMDLAPLPWRCLGKPSAQQLTLEQLQAWPQLFIDRGLRHKQLWSEAQAAKLLALSLGDGDSAGMELDLMYPRDKDQNDLALGLALIPSSIEHIHLLGFSGGRRDHELANWGTLLTWLAKREKTQMWLDQNIYFCSPGRWQLELQGSFSMFNLQPGLIQLAGACRYRLERPTALTPLSAHGLSNEAQGLIELSTDTPLMLMQYPE